MSRLRPALRALLASALLAAVVSELRAEEDPGTSCTPERLSALVGGPVHAACMADVEQFGMASVIWAGTDGGVVSLDATNPDDLRYRSIVSTATPVRDVAWDGRRIFAAAGRGGLLVLDSVLSSSPAIRGKYETGGFVIALALRTNVALFADSTRGLFAVDVTTPEEPLLTTFVPLSAGATDLAIDGSLAVVAGGPGGLFVFDIQSPAAPKLRGNLSLPDYANGVAISGNRAWVTTPGSLHVVDLSVPTAPALLGSTDLPREAGRLRISGGMAYVSCGEAGIALVNISDAAAPALVAFLDTPGSAVAVLTGSPYGAVADLHGGVRIVDYTSSVSPFLRGSYRGPATSRAARTQGTLLYSAAEAEGLLVYDVTIPEQPHLVTQLAIAGTTVDVVPSGSRVFVANEERGLQVVDLSDLTNPYVLATLELPTGARGIALSGALALVAAGTGGLVAVDVSTPASPDVIASVATRGEASAVTLAGRTAFVSEGAFGLELFDVTDPQRMSPLSVYDPVGSVRDVSVAGKLALVAASGDGIHVVSIEDPASPRRIAVADTPGTASAVAAAGIQAFVADGKSGIRVVDLDPPEEAELKGSLANPGVAVGIHISSTTAYLSCAGAGLHVFDVYTCTADVAEPVPSFTATPQPACEGQPISFADTSSGKPLVWYWEFGDGGISTSQNPTHAYAAAGTYDVVFTAKNPGGVATLTRPVEVIVEPAAPVPTAPEAGAVDLPFENLGFAWSDENAKSWRLELFRGESCAEPLVRFDPIDAPTYRVGSLPRGEILSYRIVASNSCGISSPSVCSSFGTVPVAAFDWSPRPACAGQPVTFESRSTGQDLAAEWRFPDGTTARGEAVEHVFSGEGGAEVSLSVSGPAGRAATSLSVSVTDRPEAAISVSGSPVFAGVAARFHDVGTRSPSGHSWEFGDGSASSAAEPEHAFGEIGTYRVRLESRNSCGSDEAVAVVPVGVSPAPSIAPVETIGCTFRSVRLSASGARAPEGWPVRWHWSFGDGTQQDGGPSPVHSWERAGRHLVTVSAATPWGEGAGAATVGIESAPEGLAGASAIRGEIVAGQPIAWNVVATGAASASWFFDDGAVAEGFGVVRGFATAGAHSAEVRLAGACGEVRIPLTIDVAPARTEAAIEAPASSRTGEPIRFRSRSTGGLLATWSFGDGGTAIGDEAVHAYAAAGTYDVSLTVSGATESRAGAKIEVVPAVDSALPDFLFVPANPRVGDTITLIAVSPEPDERIAWSASDGWNATGGVTTHVFGRAGEARVRIDAGGGSFARTISVLPAEPDADFDFTPPNAGALRRLVFRALTASPAHHWDFGDGATATGASPDHTYAAAGEYRVVLALESGATAERVVTVRPETGTWAPERSLLVAPEDGAGSPEATLVLWNPNDADLRFRATPLSGTGGISGVLGPRRTLALPAPSTALRIESGSPVAAPLGAVLRTAAPAGGARPGEAWLPGTGSRALSGVRRVASGESAIVFLNPAAEPLAGTLLLRDERGEELDRALIVLPAGSRESRRLGDWFPALTGDLRDGEVELVGPEELRLFGGEVERSGDPSRLTPSAAARLVLPRVRRIDGPVSVSCDLVLRNPAPDEQLVRLTFRASSGSRTVEIPLPAGGHVRLEDLLGAGAFRIGEGEGLLEIEADEPVEAAATETFWRGSSPGTRTALPLLRAADAAGSSSIRREISAAPVVSGAIGATRTTADLVLLAASVQPAVVAVRFLDADGTLLLERTGLTVTAVRPLVLRNPLADLARPVDSGSVVVTAVDGGSVFGALVLRDELSGDETAIPLR